MEVKGGRKARWCVSGQHFSHLSRQSHPSTDFLGSFTYHQRNFQGQIKNNSHFLVQGPSTIWEIFLSGVMGRTGFSAWKPAHCQMGLSISHYKGACLQDAISAIKKRKTFTVKQILSTKGYIF